MNKGVGGSYKVTCKCLKRKSGVSPSLAETLLSVWTAGPEPPRHELLSDREYQTMCALASGKRLTTIAKELSLSLKTVGTYRRRVLHKMKMTSNAELVRYVVEHKLLV
jgi:DNA-binding NarL/FixJ family response regulator